MVALAFPPVAYRSVSLARISIRTDPGPWLRLTSDGIPDLTPLGSVCDAASISDLFSRNAYESQVLATLTNSKVGLRIEKYPHNAPAEAESESFNNEFYQQIFLKSFGTCPLPYRRKIENNCKSHRTGDEFECDLYVKLPVNDDSLTVDRLLQLSTATVVNIAGKWVLIEISESAQHLVHKLYQLERALHFLPRAASDFATADVGAVIVLLNGKREDAELAMSHCKNLKTELLISGIPVFVGWVPFRNLFSTINTVNTKVEKLQSNVVSMQSNIVSMQSNIVSMNDKMDRMDSDLKSNIVSMNSMNDKMNSMNDKMDLLTLSMAALVESIDRK